MSNRKAVYFAGGRATIVLLAISAAHSVVAAPYVVPAEASLAATEHVCSSCHGIAGQSESPQFPRLAGQQKDYLVVELTKFRSHERADADAHKYMWGMTALLSDSEIEGLADWYSSQEPVSAQVDDVAKVAAGKRIFDEGAPDQGIPACAACHGASAEGAGEFPRLAGQHRDYLALQLTNFASGVRANDVMFPTAKSLTAEQIESLTAYLSSIATER